MYNKLNRLLSLTVLFVMLSNMVIVPYAQAKQLDQQTATDPLAKMWELGETYTLSHGQMVESSLALSSMLTYLTNQPYLEVDEATLETAQGLAQETINQAAQALGATGGLSTELDEIVPVLHPLQTPDPANVHWQGSFPTELETSLGNLGLSQSQLDALALEVQTKSDVRQAMGTNGLPAGTQQDLLSIGFTITETQELETGLTQSGVFQSGLTRQLDHLKSSQFELATVRIEALVIYAQLLTQHIAVRRANGIEARAFAASQLETIADDQLRLLIHVGHLNSQWGANPDLEKGEGDWLFIERYAAQAAERIAQLIVETQNPGLLLDFFIIKQMETTAITALAGDPAYARDELTQLADLLSLALGDSTEAQAMLNPLLDSQPGLVAQYGPQWLQEYWTVDLEAEAQAYARTRVAGLASPLRQTEAGAIPETDETNNIDTLLYNATPGMDYDPLNADLISQMQAFGGGLGHIPFFNFLWGVLGGQTDYPLAIGLNALISMIPVVGLATDIMSLLIDPDILVKVMAFFGILTGLGEITFVIPVLGQVTGSGSFVGDKAIAATKFVYQLLRQAGSPFVKVAQKMRFKQAASFLVDMLGVVLERATKTITDSATWSSATQLLTALKNLVTGVFDSLTGISSELGLTGLLKYAGSEGGMLLGRVFGLSDEATNAVLKSRADEIVKIGDDLLGEAVADLNDDTVKFLGSMVDEAGGEKTQRFLSKITCPTGLAYTPFQRSSGLASPLIAENSLATCMNAFSAIGEGTARSGFVKVMIGDPEEAAKLWNKYKSHSARDNLFEILNNAHILDSADFVKKLEKIGGIDKTDQLKILFDKVPADEARERVNIIVQRAINAGQGDSVKIAAEFDILTELVSKLGRKDLPGNLNSFKPSNLSDYGFDGANVQHFLEGHTYEYLAIGKRTTKPTTFWPEGTTPHDIKKYLEDALENLARDGEIPKKAELKTHIKIKSGHEIEVTVATLVEPNGNKLINRFGPETNPILETIIARRMKAIAGLFAQLPLN